MQRFDRMSLYNNKKTKYKIRITNRNRKPAKLKGWYGMNYEVETGKCQRNRSSILNKLEWVPLSSNAHHVTCDM